MQPKLQIKIWIPKIFIYNLLYVKKCHTLRIIYRIALWRFIDHSANYMRRKRYLRVPQNTYFQKFNNNFLLRSIRYRTQHFLFWFDFCLLISSLKALDTMCSEIERQKFNFCNSEVNYRLTRVKTSIKFQSTMRLIW